jgi:hypothetical protein
MKSIGELRAYLQRTGAKWRPAASLPDSALIPVVKTGGAPPLTPAQTKPNLTLADVLAIASKPTPNKLLLQRRIDLGLVQVDPSTKLPKPRYLPGGPIPDPLILPTTVDWRQRFGFNWLASVQTQACADCWAFATVALVSTQTRIEHCAWFKRSEGEVRQAIDPTCCSQGSGDNMEAALAWIANNGVTGEDCAPYTSTDGTVAVCGDRSARTVQVNYANAQFMVPDMTAAAGHEYDAQKLWLDQIGPFATWLDYSLVAAWDPASGPFDSFNTCDPEAQKNTCLGHYMLVVGYDDTQTTPSWIMRNSYGPNWGMNGYMYMAYGAACTDTYHHMGLTSPIPDPWSKRRQHSGGMIESEIGALSCNFELLSTTKTTEEPNQCAHMYRDGSSLIWNTKELFAGDVADFPTLIETTFGRNFECVYRSTNGQLHHWYYDRTTNIWGDGGTFGPMTTVRRPGFIQSNYVSPGNFEVVVATSNGTLQHLWRDNSNTAYVWNTAETFGANILLGGPTLVQSQYGSQGNFEFVALLTSGQLQHFYRDNDGDEVWIAGPTFGGAVTGTPCMIEGQYGATNENAVGNFELCVASVGQIQHWYRDNQAGNVWILATTFGNNIQDVIALVQGSYGFNLELVALLTDGSLQHYYRDQNLVWHTGSIFGTA